MAQIEELSQSRIHQATQLAEARQKVLASRTKDREEMEKLEGELRTAKSNLRQAQEKAKEVPILSLLYYLAENVSTNFFL